MPLFLASVGDAPYTHGVSQLLTGKPTSEAHCMTIRAAVLQCTIPHAQAVRFKAVEPPTRRTSHTELPGRWRALGEARGSILYYLAGLLVYQPSLPLRPASRICSQECSRRPGRTFSVVHRPAPTLGYTYITFATSLAAGSRYWMPFDVRPVLCCWAHLKRWNTMSAKTTKSKMIDQSIIV